MVNPNNMTFEEMGIKLKGLYLKLLNTEKHIEYLIALREQTIEDIELCETLIMHQMNRRDRIKDYER